MGGVHYYPSGALCWFETNQYGDPTGSVYYVKKIPDMKLLETPRRQRGFRKLLKQQNKVMNLKEKFTKERADTEEWSYPKPRLNMK